MGACGHLLAGESLQNLVHEHCHLEAAISRGQQRVHAHDRGVRIVEVGEGAEAVTGNDAQLHCRPI